MVRQSYVVNEIFVEGKPCKKKPGKARRAKKSLELLAFLAFPCFFTSKRPRKGWRSNEILGFLGKPGVVFQEKPGEPGGNSWLSRKAWNLTTVGRARKAKKARNFTLEFRGIPGSFLQGKKKEQGSLHNKHFCCTCLAKKLG